MAQYTVYRLLMSLCTQRKLRITLTIMVLLVLLVMLRQVVIPDLQHQTSEEAQRWCPNWTGLHGGQGERAMQHDLSTAVLRRSWEKYPGQTWRGLQLPVLSVMPLGRLGNVIQEYATLYALGRAYNVTVVLNPVFQSALLPIFPNASISPLPGSFDLQDWTMVHRTSRMNYAKAEVAASGLLGPGRFLIRDYPMLMQLFHYYKAELQRELTFAPEIARKAKDFLRMSVKAWQWRTTRNDTPILIGIHIRRTDYVAHAKRFGGVLPGAQYLHRALKYYRDKFEQVLFIAASDDYKYVKDTFKNQTDIVLAPGTTREVDMAVMVGCNHSIITLGSFGFWCGYLADGEVVYPNVTFTSYYHFWYASYTQAGIHNFTPLSPN